MIQEIQGMKKAVAKIYQRNKDSELNYQKKIER